MSTHRDLLSLTRNAIAKLDKGGAPVLRKSTAPADAPTPLFDALVLERAAWFYLGKRRAA